MISKYNFSVLFVLLVLMVPACKNDRNKKNKDLHTKTVRNRAENDYVKIALEDTQSSLEELFDTRGEEVVALEDAVNIDWTDIQETPALKTVYFDFDRDEVRSDQRAAVEYDATLIKEQIAQLAQTGKDVEVLVEGHTCNIGTEKHNKVLSLNRAKAVEKELANSGIQVPIKVAGRGSVVPNVIDGKAVTGNNRTDLAPNRRVEVRVITV